MSYEPTNWKNGDIVTAEKLNKIESQLEQNDGLAPLILSGDDLMQILDPIITEYEAVHTDVLTKAGDNIGVEQLSSCYTEERQKAAALYDNLSMIRDAYNANRFVYVDYYGLGRFPLTIVCDSVYQGMFISISIQQLMPGSDMAVLHKDTSYFSVIADSDHESVSIGVTHIVITGSIVTV